jgi:hypothetical protein
LSIFSRLVHCAFAVIRSTIFCFAFHRYSHFFSFLSTDDRGFGFFDLFAPTLGVRDPVSGNLTGQKTDYLSLENKYWRVIHLDTGWYSDKTYFQQHVDWLWH